MKVRKLFLKWGLIGILGLPLHAYAEYEWCPIVRQPTQYQIVIDGTSCPVKSARYEQRVLKVRYHCMTSDGVRSGGFSGRQTGDSSFRGRYIVQSKLGTMNGPLEINFTGPDQIVLESRGRQYAARIAHYEKD